MPGCRAAAASQRKKEKGPICLKRRRCPVAEPKPQARQRKRVQRGKRRQREVEREEQNFPSQTRAERRGQTNKGQPRDSADERKQGKGSEWAERGREKIMKKAPALQAAGAFRTIFGSDLLSHMTLCSIIGDGELNYRVRNGVGCTLSSMATKEILSNIITRDGRNFRENKTHGLLVLVSSTPHGASTSSLSTR